MANGDEKIAEQFKRAIDEVAEEAQADIVFYSGDIEPPGDRKLVKQVRLFGSRKNVILFLTTNGGDAACAFRIARCLQRTYKQGTFTLFVDGFCKSAGTLIALGADAIVMSELAELGPLDVQLLKSDALGEQTSGLTPTRAINTLRELAFETLEASFLNLRFRSGLQITTRTALEVATNLTTGLFCPVFQQIDPMRLGEISLAMLIAEEYGTRLASESVKEGALKRLIEAYPSHGFVIDREEASQLFSAVREPTNKEAALAEFLSSFSGDSRDPLVLFLTHGETTDSKAGEEEEENDADDSDDQDQAQNKGHGEARNSAGAGTDGEPPAEESGAKATPLATKRPRRKA